jgi:uncharacterized protein YqeY
MGAASSSEPPSDASVAPRFAETLRRDLSKAMTNGDRVEIDVLRTTLAAVANAEAPSVDAQPSSPVPNGSSESAPLALSTTDINRILRDEIAERRSVIADYEQAGHAARADRLRAEIAMIERYLS